MRASTIPPMVRGLGLGYGRGLVSVLAACWSERAHAGGRRRGDPELRDGLDPAMSRDDLTTFLASERGWA